MTGKKKYRINELLDNFSVKKNKQAIQMLPGILGVSPATFNNYRAIVLEDPRDIPHEKVVMLEQFFGLRPGELANYTPHITPISQMADIEPTCPEFFGLTKP